MEFLQSFIDYIENARSVRLAHLVALEVPGGGFSYHTDYSRDITYGGQIYKSGLIKDIGSVKQTRRFASYDLTVSLSGADPIELQRALNSSAYLNRKITIHRAYLDTNGDIIPMLVNGDTLKYFEGVINKAGVKDSAKVSGAGSSLVSWTCSSEFADFKKVSGRITDDASHRGLAYREGFEGLQPSASAKRPEYQTDLGFFHANRSVSTLAQYQVAETRYRTKVKKNWYGGVKSVKNEEYTVMVDKEVDLRYDLTAQYIPVVYGTRQVSGIPIFVDTLVDDPNTVYAVYSFCEGEIEGFLDFYIGDNPAICWDDTLDPENRVCYGAKKTLGNTINISSPNGTSPTTHGDTYIVDDGDGPIEFTVYHGKYDQTASSILKSIAAAGNFYLQQNPPEGGAPIGPEYWDDNFKLLDTAYAVVKFQLSEDRPEIPDISADVSGRIIPKYNSSGLPVVTGTTSINPAWQLADYMQSSTFGGNIGVDRIDLKSFYKVAQLCDTIDTSYERAWVPYWKYVGWNAFVTGEDPRKMIQCNTLLNTDSSIFKNMDSQLQQIDASLNVVSGVHVLTLLAERPVVTSLSTHDVINGDVSLSDNSVNTRYNAVQAGLIDPGKQWGANQITFYNSDFKAQDNGVERKGGFQFPYITNYYTARSTAERFLKSSRSSRTLTVTVPFTKAYLAVNDHIAFTSTRYSWDSKRWIVSDLTWTKDGKVKIVASEYLDGMFINSPQDDISEGQLPNIGYNVLPVNDLQYIPYSPAPGTGGIEGKSGDLAWYPSRTPGLAYYLITWTGLASNKVLAVDPTKPITSRLFYPISDLEPGIYTFSVRAVDSAGRASKASLITLTVDSAKVLHNITGFVALNASTVHAGSWVGADLELAWDRYPTEDIPVGLAYNIEISTLDGEAAISLRDVVIPSVDTLNYTYTFALNKQDHIVSEGVVGTHRELVVRIRATADGDRVSGSWSYL